MQKKTYLLILFILAFGILSNIFTATILTKDTSFVLAVLWGIIGWFYYPPYIHNIINSNKNRAVAWSILSVMLFSMFLPWLNYRQSIIDTFFSQRFNYFILILLVFLRIRPTGKDFIYVIKSCAYISIAGFIISLVYPTFFKTPEAIKDILETRTESGSTDIGFAGPGYTLVPFYLYFKIGKLFRQPSVNDIIETTVFMLYIIIIQNRSTIIGTLPFFCIGILLMKTPKKGLFMFMSFGIIIAILPFLSSIYDALVNETQRQLENDNYNRWQALSLYLIEMKQDILSILFGNGVWSKSGSYLTMMFLAQKARGTYISDIGWLGAYFYYGIIPVLLLLWYAIKAIYIKEVPLFLKFFSIWLILVPTIHPYLMLGTGGALEFAMFFYLVMYYTTTRKRKVTKLNTQ